MESGADRYKACRSGLNEWCVWLFHSVGCAAVRLCWAGQLGAQGQQSRHISSEGRGVGACTKTLLYERGCMVCRSCQGVLMGTTETWQRQQAASSSRLSDVITAAQSVQRDRLASRSGEVRESEPPPPPHPPALGSPATPERQSCTLQLSHAGPTPPAVHGGGRSGCISLLQAGGQQPAAAGPLFLAQA